MWVLWLLSEICNQSTTLLLLHSAALVASFNLSFPECSIFICFGKFAFLILALLCTILNTLVDIQSSCRKLSDSKNSHALYSTRTGKAKWFYPQSYRTNRSAELYARYANEVAVHIDMFLTVYMLSIPKRQLLACRSRGISFYGTWKRWI